jgi:hypothetical protein
MRRNRRILKLVLLPIAAAIIAACSLGRQNVPMKTYSRIDIPDGEFLHYSDYFNGEKMVDHYYVTKIVKNGNGGIFYRIYYDILSYGGNRNLPENYENWPVRILIDPVSGSTIDSEGNINQNDLKSYNPSSFGIGGLTYWHYRLFRDKGYVEYVSRSASGEKTLMQTFKVKIDPAFPSTDAFSLLFVYRLMDTESHGIIYWVMPYFMKDPMPVTLRSIKKETISIKSGTYKTIKVDTVMGDRFFATLMEPFTKYSSVLVEDSDRRLLIKSQVQNKVTLLEEISNVK